MITHLAPAENAREPDPFAGEDHPMRVITRAAAAGEWNDQASSDVTSLFNAMAPEWSEPRRDDRYMPLLDAVDRGRVSGQRVLELGAGTGLGTELLHERFTNVVAMDLAMEMLRHSVATAPRANADASTLPLPDDAVDVVVMVNMILFPEEVDRVLAADGTVVWVNTWGEQTPIHLSAEDVDAALPGEWVGEASRYGAGTWAVLRRS